MASISLSTLPGTENAAANASALVLRSPSNESQSCWWVVHFKWSAPVIGVIAVSSGAAGAELDASWESSELQAAETRSANAHAVNSKHQRAL